MEKEEQGREAGVQLQFGQITLGNLISIIAMLVTVFLAYSRLDTDIAVLQVQIKSLLETVGRLERRVDERRSEVPAGVNIGSSQVPLWSAVPLGRAISDDGRRF